MPSRTLQLHAYRTIWWQKESTYRQNFAKPFDFFPFNDFNDLAAKQSYQHLPTLYQKLKQEQSSLSFQEWKFNNLGLQLGLNPETSDFGIKVYDLAVTLFPESANLYDSLAEVHFFAGNRKEAILNFKKSLILNPGNTNARHRLKQLED